MAVAFFSMTADFMSFHRRPFIQRLATALAQQGHSALCFNRPRWCLTALLKKAPAIPVPASVAGVQVHNLWTLWPAGWCFGSPLLTYWLVALPIRWQVNRLLQRLAEPRNLVWFYKPDQYLYLRHLGLEYAYTHFDNYDDDSGYPFSRHPLYSSTLKQCLSNSRIAFATSRALQQKLLAIHPVTYLPNAVDDQLVPANLPQCRHHSRPVIGFVGAIDESTDAQLIAALCAALPACDLVMVGAVRNSGIQALAEVHANLRLLGRREYAQLAEVIKSFDVGICPYVASPFNRYRNPLKIYEYLAFGIPVITTCCDFEPEAQHLIYQADTSVEFIAAVNAALNDNSDDRRQQRYTFARANTWRFRAHQALSALAIENKDCISMTGYFDHLRGKIKPFISPDAAIEHCREIIERCGAFSLAFANAHAFNLGRVDKKFGSALLGNDLILRDGIGVKWLMQSVGQEPGYNLNGTDFIPLLLPAIFKGKRLAVYGAREQELEKAQPKLQQLGLQVVDLFHGFADSEDYLGRIRNCQPDVVLLAMGMPKQELIAERIAQVFSGVSVINGGAIVDFMAGKVSRAPLWVRRVGMEWLYRLLLEPRRLFKRYVVGNAVFLFHASRVARQAPND